jgi:hypothetical protein
VGRGLWEANPFADRTANPRCRRTDSPPTAESQRAAETAWTYLAFDSVSPYIDTRPPLVANQAEQRRYRMRYRDADVPVGEFCDTLNVTVGP